MIKAGVIFIEYGSGDDINIYNNKFYNCSTEEDGGVIYADKNIKLNIENNIFDGSKS